LPLLQSQRLLTEYCLKSLLKSYFEKYENDCDAGFFKFIHTTKKLIDLALFLSLNAVLEDTFPLLLLEDAFDCCPLTHVELLFEFMVARRELLLKVTFTFSSAR